MNADDYKTEELQQAELINGNAVLKPEDPGLYPVIVHCLAADSFVHWLKENKTFLDNTLSEYGAVLFRGFPVKDVHGFREILPGLFDKEIAYKERTSPRHPIVGHVYSSTDHPSDQVIQMHTESSYAAVFPNRICFYAQTPPLAGGETPIADVRKVASLLSAATIEKFSHLGVKYVRNIMDGAGLGWKEIFQVNSREELEKVLSGSGMQHEWVKEDHLRITWTRPAFQQHPVNGNKVWFNHAFFYSKSLIDEYIREVIPDEELPFVSYYGDGSEIEDQVIHEISNAYDKTKIIFPWEKDDVLLLDNMLFAHGRMSFRGERKILVAMGNPVG